MLYFFEMNDFEAQGNLCWKDLVHGAASANSDFTAGTT